MTARLQIQRVEKLALKNTIIIMTSNAGANRIIDPKHLGFSRDITEKQDYEKDESKCYGRS